MRPGSPLSHWDLPEARAVVLNQPGNEREQDPVPTSDWSRFLCMASRSCTWRGSASGDHLVSLSPAVSIAKKYLVSTGREQPLCQARLAQRPVEG